MRQFCKYPLLIELARLAAPQLPFLGSCPENDHPAVKRFFRRGLRLYALAPTAYAMGYHRLVAVTVVSAPFPIPLGIRFQKDGEAEIPHRAGLCDVAAALPGAPIPGAPATVFLPRGKIDRAAQFFNAFRRSGDHYNFRRLPRSPQPARNRQPAGWEDAPYRIAGGDVRRNLTGRLSG